MQPWLEPVRIAETGQLLQAITSACCTASSDRSIALARVHADRLYAIAHRILRDEAGALANRDQIDRGFRRLPPEQRAILVLHHYLGLTSGEIADTLAIPAGTVRSRLHYAHRAMRAALEADARRPVASGGRSS
jgi:DNA-directed RNA polymerase specialized sigma24 family protein